MYSVDCKDGESKPRLVVLGNVSNILSASTRLTILEEGISLMFYRIRLALKEEREIKEQGRQEAYQEMAVLKPKHVAKLLQSRRRDTIPSNLKRKNASYFFDFS